ncbi:MAG: SDR family oxidoreductase, partial [Pseudomonadota bacterium]
VASNLSPGRSLIATLKALSDDSNRLVAAPGDIANADTANAMVELAIQEMNGLNFLINNAGTPATRTPISPADFDLQSEDLWQRLLDVNLLGPFRCTKAAANALRASNGAIVNTASVAAFGGGGSSSPYCATKGALVSITREWSRALAPDVRVNAIAPGLVDSEWMCSFDETSFDLSSEIPLKRKGFPEEYAEMILYLAAGATYMTGQTVIVDGGMMT